MKIVDALIALLITLIALTLLLRVFVGPALSDVVMHPTMPGTDYRDYSRPGILVEQEGNKSVYYHTIPGTDYKDYSRPGMVVEGGTSYPTIPGTPYRDYNGAGWGMHHGR